MRNDLTGVRRRIVLVHADVEEEGAILERAVACGMAVSQLFRGTVFAPVRMPERAVVVGVDAMDEAGSALGHAVRGEAGLGLQDVLRLARRLRDRIMDLRIEWTREPLPKGLYSWQAVEKRTGADEPKRDRALGFRCTDAELHRIRAHADACRLPVSAYARQRALGRPVHPAAQPVEGMAAVRSVLGLMHHAAMQVPAVDAAVMRLRAEAMEYVWRLREEALGKEAAS